MWWCQVIVPTLISRAAATPPTHVDPLAVLMIKDAGSLIHLFTLHLPPTAFRSLFLSIKFTSQVLCWRDLRGAVAKALFDLIPVIHRKNKKSGENNNNMPWGSHGASQQESRAFVPPGHIKCVHPAGARGHTSIQSSEGEDTAWIQSWMIHFLSSQHFPHSQLPLRCESLCSLTVGPSRLLNIYSQSLPHSCFLS